MDSPDVFEFVSGLPKENARIVIAPSISSEAELFDFYATELTFPDYFGRNWDAFIDCLSDLSWIDADEVAVLHDGLPSFPMSELRHYVEILQFVLDRYRSRPSQRPRLRIYFTEPCRPVVECLLAGTPGSNVPS